MNRMGSKWETSSRLHGANWETTPVRAKLDVSGGSPLFLPGKSVYAPINIAELPLDSFESPAPSPSLKAQSEHQVGGKIMKFLKLRRKSEGSTFSQTAFQPSLTTFRFQDQGRSSVSVEDVDLERYHYDSDELSEGVNRDRRHGSSCSATSDASSSRSSNSTQSFSSMTSRASGTPRASFMLGGPVHQSGAQLMATILLSISNLDEDEDEDDIAYECEHPSTLDGPHESAWHQPRDEMLAFSLGAGRHGSAKHSSGRNTPRLGRCSIDLHLTSPGPSRRFGKLDLSRLDKFR